MNYSFKKEVVEFEYKMWIALAIEKFTVLPFSMVIIASEE